MGFEALLSPKAVSERTGGVVSAEFVRAACRRSPGHHRLPHIESGRTRPVLKIRWSDFERWYEEEMHGSEME